MDDTLFSINPTDWKSFELVQNVIDTFPDPIFVKDLQHRWIACNSAFCTLLGRSYAEVIGHGDPDYFPPEQVKVFWEGDDQVVSTGQPIENEELLTHQDGSVHVIWTRKFPLKNDQGTPIGSCGIITDITEIRRRQEQVAALEAEIKSQMEIIQTQGAMLDELSVPVIQVWENILLLPLIGAIESRRAAQIMESLLQAISAHRAANVSGDLDLARRRLQPDRHAGHARERARARHAAGPGGRGDPDALTRGAHMGSMTDSARRERSLGVTIHRG